MKIYTIVYIKKYNDKSEYHIVRKDIVVDKNVIVDKDWVLYWMTDAVDVVSINLREKQFFTINNVSLKGQPGLKIFCEEELKDNYLINDKEHYIVIPQIDNKLVKLEWQDAHYDFNRVFNKYTIIDGE